MHESKKLIEEDQICIMNSWSDQRYAWFAMLVLWGRLSNQELFQLRKT